MSSLEFLDIDEFNNHIQDSDNEEMINYVSNKLLRLEESFVMQYKHKENESVNINLSFSNFQDGNCGGRENEVRPLHIEYVEEIFHEINSINDVLIKIVRSNYTKNEKLQTLGNKYKELCEGYSSFKINYQMQMEELSIKENQILNFEEILRNYENENYDLKLKVDELSYSLNKLKERQKNIRKYSEENSILCTEENQGVNNEKLLNEKIAFLEEVNQQLTNEKEDLNNIVDILRVNNLKKEENICAILRELDIERAIITTQKDQIKKLKNDKNIVKNEMQVLQKEKDKNNRLVETMKNKKINFTKTHLVLDAISTKLESEFDTNSKPLERRNSKLR